MSPCGVYTCIVVHVSRRSAGDQRRTQLSRKVQLRSSRSFGLKMVNQQGEHWRGIDPSSITTYLLFYFLIPD